MQGRIRVLKRGVWLYDAAIELPVRVIALDWEWLREEDDPEPQALDESGWAYYVQFGRLQRDPSKINPEVQGAFTATARLLGLDCFHSPREFRHTPADAAKAAERLAPTIRWAIDDAPAA